MFAKLTGTVDTIGEEHVILDVAGIGYLVFASGKTLNQLTAGSVETLLIETQVGEDYIRLYGFKTAEEQRWFRLLQSVQGVGAKVALSLLSLLSPADLVRAIATQDKARLGQANGVGPKLALRLITELKDKAGGITFATPSAAPSATPNAASSAIPSTTAIHAAANDALSALTNLGYRPAEAQAAVQAALMKTGEDVSVSALIKAALQEASR